MKNFFNDVKTWFLVLFPYIVCFFLIYLFVYFIFPHNVQEKMLNDTIKEINLRDSAKDTFNCSK